MSEEHHEQEQEEQTLSKSQMKKLKKRERAKEINALKREQTRARKKQKKAELKEKEQNGLLNEEEKQWLESVRERAQEKNSAKIQSRVLMEKAMSDPSSAVTVVMDLDFQDKMEDREIKSLCSQLNFSYGANCQTHNPVHLVFSGMHRDTQVYKHFNDKVDGFSKWLVTCHEDSFSNHFSKDRLVYLSADATEELEDLESGMVYVIGALVDHNRHKGITLQKASDIGIPAKRLRISEELLGASRRILAVNHVFDILLRYMASRDWRESCELAIPSRKQHHHKELQQE